MRTRRITRTRAQTGLSKCSLRWCTGGRFGEPARRCLRQKGEDYFCEYPTSRQIRFLSRQLAEPKQRFEPFEQQFDLPAQSVKLENGLRSMLLGQAGQQEDEFGRAQGPRINFLAGLEGSSHHLLACDLSLFRRQTSDDQTQLQMRSLRIARIDEYRAAYRLLLDLIESCEQVEQFTLRREQTKRIPAGANEEIRTAVEDGRQFARTRIIAISQSDIAPLPFKSAQPLGAAIVGQFEVINSTRQIVGQVQPMRGAICAGMADGTGINHAQSPTLPGPADLRTRFFDKSARNELEPIRSIAEPLVKRWTGHLRYRACLSPGATSKQRIAACVDKGKPQEVACALYPPGAEKSLELACRFFDRHQLADPSQSRGPGTKAERIAHAWRDRRLWLILS